MTIPMITPVPECHTFLGCTCPTCPIRNLIRPVRGRPLETPNGDTVLVQRSPRSARPSPVCFAGRQAVKTRNSRLPGPYHLRIRQSFRSTCFVNPGFVLHPCL